MYHIEILLEDFGTKVGRGDTFKSTVRNESLHETSDDNRIRVVNLATSKLLIVKNTMFPHHSIRK
jgi:hypothetical protein